MVLDVIILCVGGEKDKERGGEAGGGGGEDRFEGDKRRGSDGLWGKKKILLSRPGVRRTHSCHQTVFETGLLI